MFDFGKSLINMDPEGQKKMLGNATRGQRRAALEMGIGFNNQNQRQQPKQQKRDAYHDLDRLNTIVEKENEAHDFFGKGLADWQKNVTGNQPSKEATNLKKQFDDYEHSILSTVPKGGQRHEVLSKSLPDIKKGFLQQGHQFALDKLNERSRNVLDKGLQRLAKGALGAKDEKGVQAHDDAAFDLINKYVLSEAKFDEKDADAIYDKYLGYAGVDVEKARASENDDLPGVKPGFKMEDAEMLAANDTGSASDSGDNEEAEDAELQIPEDQDEVYEGNHYRGKVEGQEEKTEPEASQQSDVESHPKDGQPGAHRSELKDLISGDEARKEVRAFEGFESKLYNDASGHCTIGFGHKLHDGACTQADAAKYGKGISEKEAGELFDKDMAGAESTVKDLVKVPLSKNEFEALSSFVYNIGPGNFKTSTLLEKLNKKEYDNVSGEMERWIYTTDAKTNKKVKNSGLMNRRKKEADRFRGKGGSND